MQQPGMWGPVAITRLGLVNLGSGILGGCEILRCRELSYSCRMNLAASGLSLLGISSISPAVTTKNDFRAQSMSSIITPLSYGKINIRTLNLYHI